MKSQLTDHIIREALFEDRATEDITSQHLVPASEISKANIIFKEDGIVCGIIIAERVFHKLDKTAYFKSYSKDGQFVKKGTVIASVKGKTRALLAGERVALNFLMHLSGIATKTFQFTQKVKSYHVDVLDTRKTTPGLRYLEKYAVFCGGGINHRMSLYDMILVKDNHLVYSLKKYSIPEIIKILRRKSKKKIELEVDNLDQFRQALQAKPDIILLDNMSIQQLKQSVRLRNIQNLKNKILLEASGGVGLKNILSIAKTGVDRISIGSLTHSRTAVDVSLDFIL